MRRSQRTASVLASILVVTAAAPWIGAADFLRGDANDDGAVSISDTYSIVRALFHTSDFGTCTSAFDANDDGRVDLSDAFTVALSVWGAQVGLCAPYPDMGPNPNTGTRLTCVDYGNGSAISESTAQLRIRDAEAGDDGRVVFTIEATSTRPIAGYEVRVRVEGDIFAAERTADSTDLTGTEEGGLLDGRVLEETLIVTHLTSFSEEVSIDNAASGLSMTDVEVCLDRGTSAGQYTVTIESGELVDFETARAIETELVGGVLTVSDEAGAAGCSRGDLGRSQPQCGTEPSPPNCESAHELAAGEASFLRGDANADGVVSIADALTIRRWLFSCLAAPPPCGDAADVDDDGDINISDTIRLINYIHLGGPAPSAPWAEPGPDPSDDDVPCASYEVGPPMETDDVIKIGDASGAPGTIVDVPLFVTSAEPVEAFQVFLRYDPDVVTPVAGHHQSDPVAVTFDDTVYETFMRENLVTSYVAVLGPDRAPVENTILFGFVPSLLHSGFDAPAGELVHFVNIRIRLADDAPVGTVVQLEPFLDPYGPLGLRNELTVAGEARFATVIPTMEAGRLEIVGDLTILRGDSNSDRRVDISDGIFTLEWLFLGGGPPRCRDEADANDDGVVDIGDPISTFGTLFLGESSIAPPFPFRGTDTTSDDFRECDP